MRTTVPAINTEPSICSGAPVRLTVPGKGNPSTKLKLAQPFLHVQAFRGAQLSFARNQSAVETQSAVALPPGELCNGNPICSGNPIYSGNPLSSGDPNCSGDANCMCRTVACPLTAQRWAGAPGRQPRGPRGPTILTSWPTRDQSTEWAHSQPTRDQSATAVVHSDNQ